MPLKEVLIGSLSILQGEYFHSPLAQDWLPVMYREMCVCAVYLSVCFLFSTENTCRLWIQMSHPRTTNNGYLFISILSGWAVLFDSMERKNCIQNKTHQPDIAAVCDPTPDVLAFTYSKVKPDFKGCALFLCNISINKIVLRHKQCQYIQNRTI